MGYTIAEMQSKMTLIYNKKTGSIKAAFSGIQTMHVLYGAEAEDYKLIWDEVVLDKDDFILKNLQKFKVNPTTQVCEILQATNYPIASQ